ncbi:hypothetical protein SmJEL517_g05538 [Synchytrium microbalum]|uniref:Uncharacterized protein n=1 Tax=Synchytrium microbalum TaxID=1806994 RepID=A0A507BND4_9FUNG|nr:uncharacterized protein SmJEL517_g05538 [Synchytrium microbalum]TPX31007.1 hypothetical protein SmJEL517_g05538 [Synchytrium microbalum]
MLGPTDPVNESLQQSAGSSSHFGFPDSDDESFHSAKEDTDDTFIYEKSEAESIPEPQLAASSSATSPNISTSNNDRKDPWSIPPITEIKTRKAYSGPSEEAELSQIEAELELTEEELATLKGRSLDEKESGNVHFKKQEYEEAIGRYQNALDICPLRFKSERAVFHSNIAACHFLKQEWEKTVSSCTKAIELNPVYLQALRRRASANDKIGRASALTSALEDYKKVLLLDPSNKEASKAINTLPKRIELRMEEEKEEMMGKLKELGNQFLGMFGMSTDNFQMKQDEKGGYSLNIQK